jgi:hypothetical protein
MQDTSQKKTKQKNTKKQKNQKTTLINQTRKKPNNILFITYRPPITLYYQNNLNIKHSSFFSPTLIKKTSHKPNIFSEHTSWEQLTQAFC